MKKVVFILFIPTFLILSCDTKNSDSTIKSVSSKTEKSGTLKVADFEKRLDELLTLEMAAKVSGFDSSKATKEYENKTGAMFGDKNDPPSECYYFWENGRTIDIKVGKGKMNLPYKDRVGIKSVSNTSLEDFKQRYGVLTDEQKALASKKLQEEANKNKSENEKTEAEKKMMDVGTGIINQLQPEKIVGVGDAATWYPNYNELKVLYRGLLFALEVDISDDKNINREKSMELAKMIIAEKLK